MTKADLSVWATTTIGELATFVSRGITPKYDDAAPGLVINQKCIRNGRLSLERARNQSKDPPKDKLIRAGDILVNSTGEGTLGRVAQVRKEIDNCTVDSHVTIVRPREDVDSHYFGLCVRQLEAYFASQGRGATNQKELSRATIEDARILLPPLMTQKRIANLDRNYIDLFENNVRRIELLTRSARLFFQEWFIRLQYPGHEHDSIIEGVPAGWNKQRVAGLAAYISRGITPKYDDEADGIVINQKCIRDGFLNLGASRRQAKEVPANKRVRKGDVLINSTGEGTIGRVAQVNTEIKNCTVDSHITIVRPNEGIKPFFFGMSLIALEGYLAKQGRGATNQTELSRGTIEDLQILMPPSSLIEEFEGVVGPIFSQISNLFKQNGRISQARALLLPRLLDGRISV